MCIEEIIALVFAGIKAVAGPNAQLTEGLNTRRAQRDSWGTRPFGRSGQALTPGRGAWPLCNPRGFLDHQVSGSALRVLMMT